MSDTTSFADVIACVALAITLYAVALVPFFWAMRLADAKTGASAVTWGRDSAALLNKAAPAGDLFTPHGRHRKTRETL
ncbi:hypothetical protein [Streptomyces milbemycinicus]|uniref:hypothetical protein n=1 Tax=Streptomyces milbemycinicus TaxID=476552 RepID=UPI000A38BF5F|nr:hypothetical protein [Streptomyces milbemycinicus]